jgi:hypothetical protein
MDDDIPDGLQSQWHELARVRAERIRQARERTYPSD